MDTHASHGARKKRLSRALLPGALIAALIIAAPAVAQELTVQNRSNIVLGSLKLVETVTLKDKRYSFGLTSTYREGRDLANVVSARLNPTSSTKVVMHGSFDGPGNGWELKVEQKYRSFTLNFGGGSDNLLHSGLLYGQRKGKGFGFSASWSGDDRRQNTRLEIWDYIETIDVTASARHDRRGFGWSATTGDNLANLLRGVLRYETSGGIDGNGASQQVIYGKNIRGGDNRMSNLDQLRYMPEDDVFDDNGIRIRSPFYPEEEPLAWLVEGYGARLGEVDLDKKRLLQAEMVSYLSDTVWIGGNFVMKDGVTDTIDTRFGITDDDLKLATTFAYHPRTGSFDGSVQFRWTPFD